MSGINVPTFKVCKGVSTFKEAKATVEAENEGSVTPIVRFVPPDEYLKQLTLMKALLRMAKAEETGIIHSLKWAIKELDGVLGQPRASWPASSN